MTTKKKILIVDDEPTIIDLLSYILSRNHTIVATAADGQEAIEKYKEFSPDLVLLDILMPHVNGLEALEEILKINPAAKVILISAHNEKHLLDKVKELGSYAYIIKPFSEQQLTIAINQAFPD